MIYCKREKTLLRFEYNFSRVSFFLHLNKLFAIEATEVLSIVNITELVADNTGVADYCIYVGV